MNSGFSPVFLCVLSVKAFGFRKRMHRCTFSILEKKYAKGYAPSAEKASKDVLGAADRVQEPIDCAPTVIEPMQSHENAYFRIGLALASCLHGTGVNMACRCSKNRAVRAERPCRVPSKATMLAGGNFQSVSNRTNRPARKSSATSHSDLIITPASASAQS
jgi:hypothetical protein